MLVRPGYPPSSSLVDLALYLQQRESALQRQFAAAVRLIAASATVGQGERFILVDTTAGAVTVTLPLAALAYGEEPVSVKWIRGAGACAVATQSSQTIDGAAGPLTLTPLQAARTFLSDGANWHVI